MVYVTGKMEEKFTNLRAAFSFFDVDGDNNVTRAEFHSAVEKMKVKMGKVDVDKVFNYLDKDGNGEISFTEFQSFERGEVVRDRMKISRVMLIIARKLEEKFGLFRDAFKFFDKDDDQNVTKDEFFKAVN